MSPTKFRRIGVARALIAAREIVKNNWITSCMARRSGGGAAVKAETADPRTCEFCAVGAVRNVFGSIKHPNYLKAINALSDAAVRRLKRRRMYIIRPEN